MSENLENPNIKKEPTMQNKLLLVFDHRFLICLMSQSIICIFSILMYLFVIEIFF